MPVLPITTVAEAHRGSAEPNNTAPLWKRWNNYGIAALQEENLALAGEAFRRVTDLADRKDGLTNQARVYLREGELSQAEALLHKASEQYGMDPQLSYFLGRASFAQGEYAEAIAYWDAVLEQYPTDRTLLTELGEVTYLLGDYERSGDFLQRALRINPEHPGTLYHALLQAAAAGDAAAAERYRERYEYHRSLEEEAATVAA
ncbi:MAG: tetratricopeptide repeat protein, partial [Bacteroidota bacterium]